MKKLLHVSILAAIVALSVFNGCSKGPKGDAGAQGPAGAAGPDSVVHSPWATLQATGTLDQSGDSVYFQDFSASAITQAILDNGVVLSYIGFEDNTGTVGDIELAEDEGIYSDFLIGQVEISASYNFTAQGVVYRYVIIPGSILATESAFQGLSREQVKKMTYGDLNKALGTTIKTN